MAAEQPEFASEDEYAVKSHSSSSSGGKIPQFSGSKKVAVFCTTFTHSGRYGFELYLLNIDSDSIHRDDGRAAIKPVVKHEGNQEWVGCDSDSDLDSIHRDNGCVAIKPIVKHEEDQKEWVGCVLDSTLYIFRVFETKSDYLGLTLDDSVRSVKKFNFSQDNLDFWYSKMRTAGVEDSSMVIAMDAFEDAAPMLHPKYMTIAVPTPDGKKILVFQSVIDLLEPESCFELYDPLENKWTALEPPKFPMGVKFISVHSYAFKDESTFVLDSCSGYFVLYLDSDDKQQMDPLRDADLVEEQLYLYHRHVVPVGGRVISPGTVSTFELEVEFDVCPFELSQPLENCMFNPLPFIALLDHKPGDRYAYTLVSQIRDSFCLVIDVCHTDLDSLETNIVGTMRYGICDESADPMIIHLYMFVLA